MLTLLRPRNCPRRRCQRGNVTAEAALVLPVLVLFTFALIWVSGLVLTKVRLVDAARETARAIARDDTVEDAWSQGRRIAPDGATMATRTEDGTVVVTVRGAPRLPGFLGFLPEPSLEAEAVTALENPGAR